MGKSGNGIVPSKKRPGSSGQKRFLIISFAVFMLIILGGSAGFILIMRQIVHANKRTELLQTAEIQRYSLEASVNREISIVLDMAISPIIVQHFLDPSDEQLKRIAFDEIARFTKSLNSKSAFWVNDIDKEFYLGEETHYTLDPEDPGNYWYKMTMYETERFNFNINYNPDLNVTNFWINAPVFDSGGKPIGILGTGINLTEFVNAIYENNKGGSTLYFFNNTGEITGAADMDLVANKEILDRVLRTTGPEILAWAKTDSSGTMKTFSGPEGEIAVCPIPAVGWFIVSQELLSLKDYLSTGMTGLFIAIMGVIIIFFIILQIGKYAFDTLSRTRQELRVERDVIATMKDNLKIGVFLLNHEYAVQGAYSKLMEEILGTGEIEGKKFSSFLASSLSAKEAESLEDYFQMVLTRQFDAKMLEEINPIAEFSYVNNDSHRKKILRTVFTTVEHGVNDYYILGSLEDISATKELEQQLAEQADKREEEMKTFFQVVQMDPEVFGDFIEDTEYEFNQINEILKDHKLPAKDVMIRIYQSVHAMKSNAVILGLDNFSGSLHELENTIKQHRDNENVTFNDVLHVTVELENIMKEKDKFQSVIKKIEAFRTSPESKRRRDRHVLVETLTRACQKAASNQEKAVEFTVDKLDGEILENGPRRVIKEVLTQLVRNSVYHGIEMPQDRSAAGKDSQGTIRLSMTVEGSSIHLRLSDDGRGLDFDKIRKKALEIKLLSEKEADNKNKLLQVIFFPGFSTAEATDAYAGRGIGLNLVRDRIKELHGTINISSQPGKGTTFSLIIPFANKAKEKSEVS